MTINPISISINEISSQPQIMNLRKVLAAYAYRFLFSTYRALSPAFLSGLNRARNRSTTLLMETQPW